MKTSKITVSGRVQGVGFRYHTKQLAEKHHLKGWVRNMTNGTVEMMISGEEEAIQDFISDVVDNNRFYDVEGINIEPIDYRRFSIFEIIAGA